jgi:hypothetical protein
MELIESEDKEEVIQGINEKLKTCLSTLKQID